MINFKTLAGLVKCNTPKVLTCPTATLVGVILQLNCHPENQKETTLLQVFDDDKSGKLDFVEYMMAVQSTQLRSPEEKLNWIFKMYDKVGQDEQKLYRG